MRMAVGEVEILWCEKAEVKDNGGLASTVEGMCCRFVAFTDIALSIAFPLGRAGF